MALLKVNRLSAYFQACRAPFLTATIVPVLLGSVIAWHQGAGFNWFFFWLVLLGISFIHMGTNVFNDYFDHLSGNDENNLTPTSFSGGSRVIQENKLSPRSMFIFASVCFALGGLIGAYLNFKLNTNIILILGVAGILLAYFYTALPVKIGYRGMGEFTIGFCFGPLVVFGAYYAQAKSLDILPFISSIPVAILVLLIVYINEFPDYDADNSVSKNTLVVLLGKNKALKLYDILLCLVYIWIILAVAAGMLPIFCLISLITIPLALKSSANLRKNFNNIQKLLFSNASTIKLHLTIGLFLSFGFILDKIIC
ncbi:MAG: 1,4-dihydroxy-2-naphthoate octaprenyltransferase [Candidatus Omnitrophica bacterium CG11_big_fil_rev_8_21_14_0_20_42_13]|uniref:1,4-dihydroxy-2-naphthoate octaprenyltransferase n=1 Tax=Candidatus Ghiorseimicrobium undicola TaxID=1974746 RepID=A0A2H0M130_9BACT|nr:MAG: 1,4-dihydroxy-2-naphthoate octaprenyltransferase [Candidatus Omnitrophica bacterium CG11_big_fil_rev_8_21_14_0_20_42_13]